MDFIEFEELIYKPEFNMPKPHSHDYYELYFLLNGDRTLFVKDKVFFTPVNTFVAIPPFCMHKTEGGPYSRININVSQSLLSKHDERFLRSLRSPYAYKIPEEVLSLVVMLLREGVNANSINGKNKIENQISISRTILYLLQKKELTSVSNNSIEISRSQELYLYNVINYINENYRTEIQLEDLCNKFFVSKTTLCKHFREIMHCSVMEYVLRVRLNKAKSLLAYSAKSVEQVAELCGFSSANYFGLVFKKEIGVSPLHYKKSRAFS